MAALGVPHSLEWKPQKTLPVMAHQLHQRKRQAIRVLAVSYLITHLLLSFAGALHSSAFVLIRPDRNSRLTRLLPRTYRELRRGLVVNWTRRTRELRLQKRYALPDDAEITIRVIVLKRAREGM